MRKNMNIQNLEKVTEQTVAKMRQVIFRIMEQTGIIESIESGELRRPYLTEALERLIVQDDAKWLAIYLYSNNEISNLHDLYA
jgi:predicted transcriptional regulator